MKGYPDKTLTNDSFEDKVLDLFCREGIPYWTAKLLITRGIRELDLAKKFLSPDMSLIKRKNLLNFAKALEIVKKTTDIDNFMIVADYDVDGITSAAILYAMLSFLGKRNVEVFIPTREEGYGLSERHLRVALEKKVKIVIALDCGTNAVELIKKFKQNGIEVIVIDHHIPLIPIPEQLVVVNPKQSNCYYPFKDFATAGIALKFALELAKIHGKYYGELPIQLMRIAAIGTIADVVPLLDENRVIAYHGLKNLGYTKSPGIKELIRFAPKKSIDSEWISFYVAPKINAAGRLGDPKIAFDFLLTRDSKDASVLYWKIDKLNKLRKKLERKIVQDALSIYEKDATENSFFVAWSDKWQRGLLGTAASKVAKTIKSPVALFAVEGEIAVGSARSYGEIELLPVLQKMKRVFLEFGGHSKAAGLKVKTVSLCDLKKELSRFKFLPEKNFFKYELFVSPSVLTTVDFFEQINLLEPFGEGNPPPLIKTSPLLVESIMKKNFLSGLKLITPDGKTLDVKCWEESVKLPKVGDTITAVFRIRSRSSIEIVYWEETKK